MEEETKQPEKEEAKPTRSMEILDQMKVHKAEIDAALKLADEKIMTLQELKAEEIMSGTSTTGTTEQAKKEETPAEYKERVMKNERT